MIDSVKPNCKFEQIIYVASQKVYLYLHMIYFSYLAWHGINIVNTKDRISTSGIDGKKQYGMILILKCSLETFTHR